MGFSRQKYWSGVPLPSPADGYWSHEIRRHLLLGRKAMTNLGSILKSKDFTLLTKDRLVKAMVFPVVMYGCKHWSIKKAESHTIFKSWCWRRFLRVPWTAWRSNQSIVKEINPEYSLERLMLKLKLNTSVTWSEEPTQWKRPWCWERLKAGGTGDDRGCNGWIASPTHWTWTGVNSGRLWRTGKPGMLQSWDCRVRYN